jgi:Ca2+-transporting ATPase
MSVVRATVCGESIDSAASIPDLRSSLLASNLSHLCEGVNLNSTARETLDDKGAVSFSGSKTEVALLEMSKSLGYLYTDTRTKYKVLAMFPFSSERKRMSTLVQLDGSGDGRAVLYVKGASEIILASCSHALRADGQVAIINQDERKKFDSLILSYAREGFRTLCLAYREMTPEQAAQNWEDAPSPDSSHLTLVGIVGIADPIRPEVPDAVATCQRSGITVRMVTGDNAVTARQIAKQCGILTKNSVVLEGPEFRKLSKMQMKSIAPNLRVLARSSPNDKMILVKL